MRCFKWRGVDLQGVVYRGFLFALSADDLKDILFKQDIALLSWREPWWHPLVRIPLSVVVGFYVQCASLLDAGLLIHDALVTTSLSLSNQKLRAVITHVAQAVERGSSFSDALALYPEIFDTVSLEVIKSGQQAGSLALIMKKRGESLETQMHFYRQVRAALMMPGITFVFFLLMVGVIGLGVMPTLFAILKTSGKPLPTITRMVMSVSSLFSLAGLVIVGLIAGFCYSGVRFITTYRSRWHLHNILFQMPFVSFLIREKEIVFFTHTLSLLLSSGMLLAPSLLLYYRAMKPGWMQDRVKKLYEVVVAGRTVASGMSEQRDLFDHAACAMIHVGQETGTLADMFMRISRIHEQKLQERLFFIAKVIQPLLIIAMGLLVALLLFSVYIPLLSIAEIIDFH